MTKYTQAHASGDARILPPQAATWLSAALVAKCACYLEMSSLDFCGHVCNGPSRNFPEAWLFHRCSWILLPEYGEKSKVTSTPETLSFSGSCAPSWGGGRQRRKRNIWSCRTFYSFHCPPSPDTQPCWHPGPATISTFSCISEFQWMLTFVLWVEKKGISDLPFV